MKFIRLCNKAHSDRVAPRVGAWIEIRLSVTLRLCRRVAPRVGAWIEIYNTYYQDTLVIVAPRVGAWIEIPTWL